jgi:hypothetical protein
MWRPSTTLNVVRTMQLKGLGIKIWLNITFSRGDSFPRTNVLIERIWIQKVFLKKVDENLSIASDDIGRRQGVCMDWKVPIVNLLVLFSMLWLVIYGITITYLYLMVIL